MSVPIFTILTQKELTIDLSRPAMQFIVDALGSDSFALRGKRFTTFIQCEIDNFRNTLLNLIERSEPKPENSDLIGD
jgi:hypothetical protein